MSAHQLGAVSAHQLGTMSRRSLPAPSAPHTGSAS